jgi:hypothetical protein
MNLSALRSQVRSLTGIQSTDIISNADLNIFINEAYLEICRESDWPFLRNQTTLTLSSGNADYALPAGVGENAIASIVALADDSNRRQLRPRSRYSTDDSPGPMRTGHPLEYSCWRDYITFYPTPQVAETLTFRFFLEPVELSSDSDTPIIPAKFQSLVAYGASVRVLIREGDETERRTYYNTQFLNGLNQMKNDLLSERDRSLLRLGGRRRIVGRRDTTYGV